jgi:glycosyltransferase involved in cell wall biosynthesis
MLAVPARGVRDNMDKTKKILYISNIEVPYRVSFFNEFARYCDLTVLYERKKSDNRDENWTKSEKRNFKTKFLNGIKIKNESAFSLGIIKEIFGEYDKVIIGCYNSPSQMLAILLMKLFRKKYILNLDGEVFIVGKGFKSLLKKFFLRGAEQYVVAGEKAALSLKTFVKDKPVVPYYFSSLYDEEIACNSKESAERDHTVLVVGQYFEYKGMDVALAAAKMDKTIQYKFVGMGKRTPLFMAELMSDAENIEAVPFLEKKALEKEYRSCMMLVLPSRQECWGLVVNEAASFGTPLVSTWGSGAAVEFISDDYPQFLAEPGNSASLYKCIRLLKDSETKEYSVYLKKKSARYSIEKSVAVHLEACGIGN